jgi:hypothetical protein
MRSTRGLLTNSIFLFGSFFVLSFGATSALADFTYYYTGQTYDTCYGVYADAMGNCASDFHVSGSFTVTTDLIHLENLSNFTIPTDDISHLNFADGFVFHEQSGGTFTITTDSAGHIEDWFITFGFDNEGITSAHCSNYQNCTEDESGWEDGGGFTENLGTWQGPFQTDTPELPTAYLFGLGLLSLISLGLHSVAAKPPLVITRSRSSLPLGAPGTA